MPGPRVPYDTVTTNLTGVFATLLQEPIDHATADRSRLISQGILLKRPGVDAPEELRNAWARAFAEPWPADKRVIPHSIPRPGTTNPLGDAATTTRWAGGVVRGDWRSAFGVWQVPTVSEPNKKGGHDRGWDGSSWVGIDGAGTSNDVLQAGVAQVVDYRGVASVHAWYEWFAPEVADSPDYIHQTEIDNFDVQPGDTVYVAVQYAGSLPPTASGALVGYESAYNEQLHVVYLSADGHVHQLLYRDSWQYEDLMQLCPAAPPATAAGPLTAYATEYNQQQHVIYLDDSGHVHELLYDNSTDDGWQHNDLMMISPGDPTPAGPGSPLHAYVSPFNEQQHINYVDSHQRVHELYFDGGWHHNDLFERSAEPPAPVAWGSPLTGYVSEPGDQQHVNYLSDDGHVHELVYRDGWHHDDLFSLCPVPPPPPAVAASPLTGYVTTFPGGAQQHVNYLDPNGHVHELVYTDGWVHNELTAQTGAEISRIDSPLVGYQSAYNNQQHVAYIGERGFINEIFENHDQAWTPVDVSASAMWAEIAGAGSSLAGWTSTGKQHLNYVDADGHVHELYYVDDGHWIHNDLFKHATMTGVVYIGNERTREHTTITLLPPPGATFAGDTAEWIMEPPSFDGVPATLPRFTDLNFTAAVCCGPTASADASQGEVDEVTEDGVIVTQTTLGPASVQISYIGP